MQATWHRNNKETSPVPVRLCLQRKVTPISQKPSTRVQESIRRIENSLKKYPGHKAARRKEGTPSLHKHTWSTTKLFKETGQSAQLNKGSPHTFLLLHISHQIHKTVGEAFSLASRSCGFQFLHLTSPPVPPGSVHQSVQKIAPEGYF